MSLTENDITRLVEDVVQRVLGKKQAEAGDDTVSGVVAVMPCFVPAFPKAAAHIKDSIDEKVEYFDLSGANTEFGDVYVNKAVNEDDLKALMERLVVARTVVLIAPSVSTLKNIAQGNDSDFVENAMLKAILWQRDVRIVLDFKPPKFRRGSFFENIVLSIDALTSMGVKVSMYQVAIDKSNFNKLSLVTEVEVIQAHKAGEYKIVCERGAIITPLARDKARELKININ